MSFDLLNQGIMYEYIGTITQLSATSEVATIGIQFTVPNSERIFVTDLKVTMDDLGGAKTFTAQKFSSSSNELQLIISIGLDNQSVYPYKQGVITNATGIVNHAGFGFIPILGGSQFLKMVGFSSVDADKTIVFIMSYISTALPVVATAIGSGISISSETHEST